MEHTPDNHHSHHSKDSDLSMHPVGSKHDKTTHQPRSPAHANTPTPRHHDDTHHPPQTSSSLTDSGPHQPQGAAPHDAHQHHRREPFIPDEQAGLTPTIHASHHDDHGSSRHSDHDPGIFLQKLLWSTLLTLPLLAFSHHFLDLLGLQPLHFTGSHYIAPLLATLVFFYGGMVFLKGALEELKRAQAGMMTLIALAITISYGYSLMVTLGFPGEEIYWELATLIVIMLLGHWLEMRAVQNAGQALKEMAKLLPDTAVKLEGEAAVEVPLESLHSGDVLLIRPGAKIPADGLVLQGEGRVNQSMVTGESMLVAKQSGDRVLAGTINEEGAFRVEVTKTGNATYLAGIMRLVDEAQQSRSRSQRLADRAAFWLVIIALGSALITALGWLMAEAPAAVIIERVVTVMVAACPHALGLAIPLVIAISTALCAQSGLLVRNRLIFEEARRIDYVVFDKTGTLTQGSHQLDRIIPSRDTTTEEILKLAAAAESETEHMLGKALVNAARQKGLPIPVASGFESMPGRGVSAQVEGQHVMVGGPNLLTLVPGTIPHELAQAVESAAETGHTLIYVIVDREIKAVMTFADVVKPESQQTVQGLKRMGIKVAMLTGDNESVALMVSRQLGIDQYFAGVLPENKASQIQALQRQGYRVAMVGDGINDAPALAQADVGIAIGAGTDVAIESAGIVLVRSDPGDVARLIMISRAAYRKMLQNLVWATGYNALVIPLAAGVLAPWGFILPMAAGAIVMSLSTIIVALNAQLLRRIQADPKLN